MTTQEFLEYLENGPYSFPGGYPIYFLCADGGVLSHGAATERKAEILDAIQEPDTDAQWEVIACDINWEDDNLFCSHTDKRIPSAYGDNETGEIYDDETGEDIEPFTVHATFCTSNFGGIELELSPCGEHVRYRHNYGEEQPDEPKEAEIVYRPNEDLDGSTDDVGCGYYPCFIVGEGENETVYFLANFMRV